MLGEECQSMPALVEGTALEQQLAAHALGCIPEHTLLDSCTRLSVSLEESVFKVQWNPHISASPRQPWSSSWRRTPSLSKYVIVKSARRVYCHTVYNIFIPFQVSVSSSSQSSRAGSSPHMTLEELRAVNRYAESTRSLSYLPQVSAPPYPPPPHNFTTQTNTICAQPSFAIFSAEADIIVVVLYTM